VAFRLIPREERFFDDFRALSREIQRGAALLEEMLRPDHPLWDKADEIKEAEHNCDFLTHQIIKRLHRTFVTPLDREDIHAMASSLDDVIDAIDETAALVRLYQIEHVRQDARDLARIISQSTEQIVSATQVFGGGKANVTEAAVEINRLENEADRAHEIAVRRLFDEEKDPVVIMKWKEILDFLESATDRCEDVANVLEGVMVKHA
jgi:predicted phosphate transport protein (TIGR00153 family)